MTRSITARLSAVATAAMLAAAGSAATAQTRPGSETPAASGETTTLSGGTAASGGTGPQAPGPTAPTGTPAPTGAPTPSSATRQPGGLGQSDTQAPFRRSVFTGNEMHMATFNVLGSDCSSGPRPDVRIVTPPANGTVRYDAISAPVDRVSYAPRAFCNGKRADSVGIYYKSRRGYVGNDAVTIDVDFKQGFVRRFSYAIEVR